MVLKPQPGDYCDKETFFIDFEKYLGENIDVKAGSEIHFLCKAWQDDFDFAFFTKGKLDQEVEAVLQEDDFAVKPSTHADMYGSSTEEEGQFPCIYYKIK